MILSAGGSWDEGSASFLAYNPDADISLVEDVIVVTVNYRLNVFGFLASTALRNQVCPGVAMFLVYLSDDWRDWMETRIPMAQRETMVSRCDFRQIPSFTPPHSCDGDGDCV